MAKHVHPWDASDDELNEIRKGGGLARGDRGVGKFDKSANDANPYPWPRIGGLNTSDDLAPYSDTKLGRVDKLIAEGCMDPDLGAEYGLPPSSAQSAGERRGLYRYENKPGTSNPAPGKTGAGE